MKNFSSFMVSNLNNNCTCCVTIVLTISVACTIGEWASCINQQPKKSIASSFNHFLYVLVFTSTFNSLYVLPDTSTCQKALMVSNSNVFIMASLGASLISSSISMNL